MIYLKKLIVIAFLIIHSPCNLAFKRPQLYKSVYKWPTVLISVLVRNKAHTLPYFLSCLYNLDYPKERTYIWMYSDFNEDKSGEIIEQWSELYGSEYGGVYIKVDNTTGPLHIDEEGPVHWSFMHHDHVIKLREMALNFARRNWLDYIFMIDADVFLTEPRTLHYLVNKDHIIVAPMLVTDGFYSNFWCGMTPSYYYKRTDEYQPILHREEVGCFKVPMVHTAVLISLKHKISDLLTYNSKTLSNYDGPPDDIITFAVNAVDNGIDLYICNDHLYGFLSVPLEEKSDIKEDFQHLTNVKLEALSRGIEIPLNDTFKDLVTYPEKSTYGCSKIFMINLTRRSKRRHLMELSFQELGMDVTHFKAVDGKNLKNSDFMNLSIVFLPNYEDPYHKRPMKSGEVGCFLSHYSIWKEIVENQYEITLILEDDIHFVPKFRSKYEQLRRELKALDWDLLYLGRKILLSDDEIYVTEHITKPLYSYWTLGYMLTLRGAQKLLAADPLSKMLPVDEFLPIMFDQHPNRSWKSLFPKRDLVALSAAPLLVEPTHYTGQEGYISDTEDSQIIEFLAERTRAMRIDF